MQFLLAHQLNQPDFVMTGVFLTSASHTCQCYQEKVADVCIYPKLKKKKISIGIETSFLPGLPIAQVIISAKVNMSPQLIGRDWGEGSI